MKIENWNIETIHIISVNIFYVESRKIIKFGKDSNGPVYLIGRQSEWAKDAENCGSKVRVI